MRKMKSLLFAVATIAMLLLASCMGSKDVTVPIDKSSDLSIPAVSIDKNILYPVGVNILDIYPASNRTLPINTSDKAITAVTVYNNTDSEVHQVNIIFTINVPQNQDVPVMTQLHGKIDDMFVNVTATQTGNTILCSFQPGPLNNFASQEVKTFKLFGVISASARDSYTITIQPYPTQYVYNNRFAVPLSGVPLTSTGSTMFF